MVKSGIIHNGLFTMISALFARLSAFSGFNTKLEKDDNLVGCGLIVQFETYKWRSNVFDVWLHLLFLGRLYDF